MSFEDLPVGTTVSVPQGKGVIRFSGTTSFAPGKWIGVDLNDPNGKNDGSVNGVAYFVCKPGHGIFVRPTGIKAVHPPEDERLARPTQAKPILQCSTPDLDQVRWEVGKFIDSSVTSDSIALKRPLPPRARSAAGHHRASGTDVSNTRLRSPSVTFLNCPMSPSDSILRSGSSDAEQLRTHVRMLMAQRADDSRRIEVLETRLSEAESFSALRPKMQARISSLSTELSATRRALVDARQLAHLSESRLAEVNTRLKTAILEKEMAEERAEIAEGGWVKLDVSQCSIRMNGR